MLLAVLTFVFYVFVYLSLIISGTMIFIVIVSNPACKNFEQTMINIIQYHTFKLKTYKKDIRKKKQHGTLNKFP